MEVVPSWFGLQLTAFLTNVKTTRSQTVRLSMMPLDIRAERARLFAVTATLISEQRANESGGDRQLS